MEGSCRRAAEAGEPTSCRAGGCLFSGYAAIHPWSPPVLERGKMFTERIQLRPRYVHVQCGGRIDIEDFLLALNRGLDTAADSGRRAVVIDALNVDGTLSSAERFVLGDQIAYAQRAHDYVAAVVVVAHEPPMEMERLAEKVALKRGAVGKSFTEMSEAEQWIEELLAGWDDEAGDSEPVS